MSGIQDDNDLPMQLAGHKVGMLAKLVPVLQPTTLCGDVAEMLNADLSLSTIVVKGEGDGLGWWIVLLSFRVFLNATTAKFISANP